MAMTTRGDARQVGAPLVIEPAAYTLHGHSFTTTPRPLLGDLACAFRERGPRCAQMETGTEHPPLPLGNKRTTLREAAAQPTHLGSRNVHRVRRHSCLKPLCNPERIGATASALTTTAAARSWSNLQRCPSRPRTTWHLFAELLHDEPMEAE